MKLQGRNLSIQLQGEDVKLLQTKLRQISYTIADLPGRVPQQIVLEFQKTSQFPTTNIVDEVTN